MRARVGAEGSYRLGVGLIGFPRGNGDSVMRNRIDIDYSHSRAIVQEIGERLRASLEIVRELPASLRMQIDRLRQLEGPSQQTLLGRRRVGHAAHGREEIARRATSRPRFVSLMAIGRLVAFDHRSGSFVLKNAGNFCV